MLPFSLKCTKIVGCWGSAPDPTGGAFSAPPDLLAVMAWDRDLMTPPRFTPPGPKSMINAGISGALRPRLGQPGIALNVRVLCTLVLCFALNIFFRVGRRILAASISGPRKKKCENSLRSTGLVCFTSTFKNGRTDTASSLQPLIGVHSRLRILRGKSHFWGGFCMFFVVVIFAISGGIWDSGGFSQEDTRN